MIKSDSTKGSITVNKYKDSRNHPDFKGRLAISDDQMRALTEMRNAGMQMSLQVAGWKNVSQEDGSKYIGLSGQVYVGDPKPQEYQQQGKAQAYQAPQEPAGWMPNQPPQAPPAQGWGGDDAAGGAAPPTQGWADDEF